MLDNRANTAETNCIFSGSITNSCNGCHWLLSLPFDVILAIGLIGFGHTPACPTLPSCSSGCPDAGLAE